MKMDMVGKKIVVLGVGISGLAVVYFVKKKIKVFGLQDVILKVFEGKDRAGGLVETRVYKDQHFELGVRGLRIRGIDELGAKFLKDIGLWDEMVLADLIVNRKFIYFDGKLRAVPSNFLVALFSPVIRGVVSAFVRDLFIRPADEAGVA